MERIKLTQEKLIEILKENDNAERMEFYYNAALNDQFEANQRMAIVGLLFMLVRYYHVKLFVNTSFNPIDFFGMNKMNVQSEYWKFYELLKKTNFEIAMCLCNDEKIPEKSLVEFSEIQAYTYFCFGNYISCLDICKNALVRDQKDSICNFIKASIIELCFVNKTSPTYKIALINYQKSLIEQCEPSKLGFDINIYHSVFSAIEHRASLLGTVERELNFTSVFEDFQATKEIIPKWTEEHHFYLCNNLFLNPLSNFGKFAEASIEELEDLPINPDSKDLFTAIVDDYKMCRGIAFSYYKGTNNVGKREMSMTYSYAYSIFDKIAFLITKVYKLDINEDKVSFTGNGLFDVKICDTQIRFRDLKNTNIIPLYLIMKEVRTKQNIKHALQIGTFEHNELRNAIDHKSLNLVKEEKLRFNTKILLGLARNAILHTFMLLHSYAENASYDIATAISTTFFETVLKRGHENGENLNESIKNK